MTLSDEITQANYDSLGLEFGLLSVIVPVYNEKYLLRHCVERILDTSLPDDLGLEILLVDDGSTDGTDEAVLRLEQEHPEVIRVFRHEKNCGKGAAVRTAVEHARGCYTIIQDADLEYDPQEYGQLLDPILMGEADVVYGSRFVPRRMRSVLNYHHALGNILLTHISNFTTGLYLTDMETCYKAFRTEILKTIPIRSNRFSLEPELTAKISKRGCRVYEVPISYRGGRNSQGKKTGWLDGFSALGTILKYWIIDDCYEQRYGHSILQSISSARRFTRWMVRVIEPWLGRNILEIGSGIGNISRFLPRRETLTLTDIDPVSMRILNSSFHDDPHVRIARLDLNSDEDFQALPDGNYDSVVCLNVLEHIDDDTSALRRIHSVLSPGGTLALLVPQYPWLFGSYDEDVEHKRRYSKSGLKRIMSEAGFEILHVQSFNMLAIPAWWLNSVLLRRHSMGRMQMKLFDMMVPLMRLLEGHMPLPGISLVAIGRKSPDEGDGRG